MTVQNTGRIIRQLSAVGALALLAAVSAAALRPTADAGPSPAGKGLDSLRLYNVAISVPDIDESARWYEEKLGFKLRSRSQVSTGIEIALIEKNGLLIDLIRIPNQRNAEGEPKDPPAHLEVLGIRNLVFHVDDLKAADAELKAKGVRLIWESRMIPEIGTAVTNFRDNNGNLIALWERRRERK